MKSTVFRVNHYQISIVVVLVGIILVSLWVYAGFYANWVFILIWSICIISAISDFSNRLIIDQHGLVIRRILHQPIQIDWNDIVEQQHFNLGEREIRYLALRKPIPVIGKMLYDRVPKELQSKILILDVWEQPTRLLTLIQPHLPAKQVSEQPFVSFAIKNQTNITRITILFTVIVGLITYFTIWML